LGAREGSRLEHVVGAVDVDVVHERLVVRGIEDERQVHERIRLRALERGPHPVSVAHVDTLELGFRHVASGRRNVADDDLLGVLAAREDVDQARADVTGSAGDHVAHGSGA
jgi:ribose 1,5-bisphosphokinase PhnN